MFEEEFDKYLWDKVSFDIYQKNQGDVQKALISSAPTLEDFKALLSPAALPFLPRMVAKSQKLTQTRFGKTVQMYVPLYLSNECQNICTYCGFSFTNKIPRKTLTEDEIIAEAKVIKSMGFDHVLLVTGEANQTVGVDYLLKAINVLRPYFSNISIEVQPLQTDEYVMLKKVGVHSILVYQETYHEETYKTHHPKGKKSIFRYRLATPDRIGIAGMHKIGLGILIGLEDWRVDSFFTALHLSYLEKKYWKTKYSISFPRLRPFNGGELIKMEMSDKELIQLITAYRLFNQEVELSISTRETPEFRNHIIHCGITSMSAASKTSPGGYSDKGHLEQFEIDDSRSTGEIITMLKNQGVEPIWKDWESAFDKVF